MSDRSKTLGLGIAAVGAGALGGFFRHAVEHAERENIAERYRSLGLHPPGECDYTLRDLDDSCPQCGNDEIRLTNKHGQTFIVHAYQLRSGTDTGDET